MTAVEKKALVTKVIWTAIDVSLLLIAAGLVLLFPIRMLELTRGMLRITIPGRSDRIIISLIAVLAFWFMCVLIPCYLVYRGEARKAVSKPSKPKKKRSSSVKKPSVSTAPVKEVIGDRDMAAAAKVASDKHVFPIYSYAENRMRDTWKCGYCDVLNPASNSSCMICGNGKR